jgi:hypothetical protein
MRPGADQLHREAADLAWLVRMASDLADKADREGDMGDVTRVAVLLRAIVRSAGETCQERWRARERSMIRVTFDIDPAGLASVHRQPPGRALAHRPGRTPRRTATSKPANWPSAVGFRDRPPLARHCPAGAARHQPCDHHWKTLLQHGLWAGPGGAWVPHPACATQAATLTEPQEV